MKINVAIVHSGFANVDDRAFFYRQEDEQEVSYWLGDVRWESATIELPNGFTIGETMYGIGVFDPQNRSVAVYAEIKNAYSAIVTLAIIDVYNSYYWSKKYQVSL